MIKKLIYENLWYLLIKLNTRIKIIILKFLFFLTLNTKKYQYLQFEKNFFINLKYRLIKKTRKSYIKVKNTK